jgi:hypothetical protein
VSVPLQSVTFWLNAFIPRDIFGATMSVRDGDFRGLTALSRPPCYLTDQRNFSNDLRAASRMHSMAKVNLTGAQPALTQWHRCDDLVECDAGGAVLYRGQGSTSNMRFSMAFSESTILLQMDCRYADLMGPPAHGIGEIEYKGTIEINPVARTIDVDLMICLFPAFEAYASIDDGPAMILFRHAPPTGILNLGPPPGAKRRIRSRFDDHERERSATKALSALG